MTTPIDHEDGALAFSQSVLVTHHGRWVLNLHKDGRVETVEFYPYGDDMTEAVSGLMKEQSARVAMHAMAAYSMERQHEFVWAQQNITSQDEAERRRAYAIMQMPQELIASHEARWAQIQQQHGDRQASDGEAPGPIQTITDAVKKATSWLRAEASVVTEGKLNDDAFNARMAACAACEHLDKRDAPLVGFCKACGCGTNSRAELTVKGRMPKATCPKGKWPALGT